MKTLEQRVAAEYEKASGVGAIVHAVKCGDLLRQAKTRCKRGDWSHWLAVHWPASVRVANDYMRLSAAVASGSIAGWESLSIDDALRSIRSRQRKPRQPQSVAEKIDTPAQDKTPAEKLDGLLWTLSATSNNVASLLNHFVNGSDDGRPVKAEWQDAKATIEETLKSSFGQGATGATRHYQTGRLEFVSENVMTGDSGLCESASWKGKGLRVTVAVEIID